MNRSEHELLRHQGIVVTSLSRSVLDDPLRLRPHYHDFFQMMLLRGKGAVLYDNSEAVVDGLTLFFPSPGQVHTVRMRKGFDGVTISFTQGFFDHRSSPPSALFELPFYFSTDMPPLLKVPRRDPSLIAQAFDEMKREHDADDLNAAEVLRAWLRILFTRILRLPGLERSMVEPTRRSVLIRQFHLAVESGFREERSLDDYARDLDVTANHLNDVIREETGRSAGSIIRQRRLLDAQRLLLHSDLPVAEIGYQTGFPDPSYFTRFFRRETGDTPVAFREKIREKYQPKVH
ncbi:MAG: AraC family transcriptional regulator [Chthoniobacteraceae bacterium]